ICREFARGLGHRGESILSDRKKGRVRRERRCKYCRARLPSIPGYKRVYCNDYCRMKNWVRIREQKIALAKEMLEQAKAGDTTQ
ncbi:MAG: hypothetical protein ACXABY_32385, partial [Candidatus Thorarchaeota archaeon]